jgi:F-type H+-transporting ATPase subunit delta
MTSALAPHYARALADAVFAPDSGLKPEEALDQLRAAEANLFSSNELQIVLLSPAVSKARKSAIVGRLADRLGLHRLIRNFLLVVVSHRRTTQMKAIVRDFEAVVDERLGWVPAEILSARELGPEERGEIETALGKKLGKFIRARYKVDASLLGGVRALAASKEYDATLRGRLENMRSHLTGHI